MGIMGALRLKEFLTPKNMKYLGILLDVVLRTGTPAWAAVWTEFDKRFAQGSGAAKIAQERLRRLYTLLQEEGMV